MSNLLLSGGTILTLDDRADAGRPATVVAVSDGRVVAVGGDDLLATQREGTELVDLGGRTLCPGFVDAHLHLSMASWTQLGLSLAGCRSADEALARLTAQAQASRDEWVYAYDYEPRRFERGGPLSRYDLDRVAGDRPVLVVHFSFHEAVVSSAGLRAAGISRHTADPRGGRILRDRLGEPTGELLEAAAGPAEVLARNTAATTRYEDWLASLTRYCQGLLAAGITHVCDPCVDRMLEGFLRRAQVEGQLPLPVTMLFSGQDGPFETPTDRLMGPATGERLDGLEVGGLKLFADGGSRCAVCASPFDALAGLVALAGRAVRLRRPALLRSSGVPERPRLGRDGHLRAGLLHYHPEQLAAFCREAHERGFQVAIHAACNAGVEQVLQAYAPLPAGRYRHRIEHLVSLDRAQARRLGESGAIGVVQPGFVTMLGDRWEAMPIPPRFRSVPLRDLLDAGMTLAGSSDAPVAPYSPLAGMQAAVTRRTLGGLTHQPEQAITPLEALRLWTTGAAQAANLAGEIGVIRPGARADLVILSENPLEVPPDRLGQIRVERTIIGGRTVHANEVPSSKFLEDHLEPET